MFTASGGNAGVKLRAPVQAACPEIPGTGQLDRSSPEPRHPAAPMPAHFVAVLDVIGFDAFAACVGYDVGREVVKQLRQLIADEIAPHALEQAGRAQFELAFSALGPTTARDCILAVSRGLSALGVLGRLGYDLKLDAGVTEARAPELDGGALDRAHQALGLARREQLRVAFAPAGGAPAVNQVALLRELKAAIESGQIEPFYMPKMRARSGQISAAEALVRWKHPARGTILPDDFIPLAEQSGLIRPLTEAMIGRSLQDQQRLSDAGFAMCIDVNLSGVLLSDPGFVDWASERLRDGGGRIGFEITETAMISDPERALDSLRRFADYGIRLAIDDYGSGYSSLAYLQKLPVHELKIDKSFISGLTKTNRDPLLVRSTIELAHALDMEVVAEGVDTPEALALLQVMGCDAAQGFLISPPLAITAFEQFLRSGGFGAHAQEAPSLARMRRLAAAKARS
jgi:diguanylate cyclase